MTGLGVYTPAALVDLMERRLQEIASQVTAGGRLVGVTGQLVEIPEPRRNGIIYDAKLADPISTEFVLLEMRPSTLLEADAQEGDTITAYGPVVANLYKGRATLRLQVDRIELAEPPEERERRAAQLPLLETVRQVGATRNPFPASPTPSMRCCGPVPPPFVMTSSERSAICARPCQSAKSKCRWPARLMWRRRSKAVWRTSWF